MRRWAGEPLALNDATVADLTRRFTGVGVEALALTGSFARGEATRHSDIDLLRFVAEAPTTPREAYHLWLLGEHLVSVTTTSIAAKRAEITQPETLIFAVPGLRQAHSLTDVSGRLAALIAEAQAFAWTQELRLAAGAFASEQLAGLAEEARKLLGALERKNTSAMLYATLGLQLGLTRAVLVARGVLLETENEYFDAALACAPPRWRRLLRVVVGYDPPGDGQAQPRARGEAALWLYMETARLLEDSLLEDDRAVVMATVARIHRTLADGSPRRQK